MKIVNERGLNKREQYYRQRITTFGDHAMAVLFLDGLTARKR